MAMTLRYTHLSPAHQLDAVERLNREETGTNTGTCTEAEEASLREDSEVAELAGKNGGPCRDRTYDPLIKSQRFSVTPCFALSLCNAH